MSSLFSDTINFVSIIEKNKENIEFIENSTESAYELFNAWLQVDTKSAIDFDDWYKGITNSIK